MDTTLAEKDSRPLRVKKTANSSITDIGGPTVILSPTRFCTRFLPNVALALAVGIVIGVPSAADARTWTDNSGKFTVEADYAGQRDGLILLTKQNGITVGVPINRLSKADADFVRSLAGGGPAPAGADPLASAQTAEATLRLIATEVDKGKLGIMWHALPKSYQADVNDLVHTFAGTMDRDIWNKGFAVGGKALNVLKTKKDFLLANAALKMAPVEGDAVGQNWEAFVDLLAILVNSELSDLDKLKTIDAGAFIDGTMNRFAEKAVTLAKSVAPQAGALPGGGRVPKITTLNDDGDTVTLQVEGPALPPGLAGGAASAFAGVGALAGAGAEGNVDAGAAVEDPGPQEVVVVRFEGRWLPEEMVDQWPAMIAAAKQAISGLSTEALAENKPQIMTVLAMVDGVLDQLLNAQTEEQFNEVIGGVMKMLGPMVGGPAAGPGGAADPFGAAAPGDDPF
jgi:hypothetical protein